MARFLGWLSSFARPIWFDKRGAGLSDRVPNGMLPTLEEWMDDLAVVMDAVDSQRARAAGHRHTGRCAHRRN